MIINLTLHTSAAAALVEQLPTTEPLKASVRTDRSELNGVGGSAVQVAFVGALSADLAVVLHDVAALAAAAGTASALVRPGDVLRPALERATAVLGQGVLGETREGDASSIFSDPETVVFELTAGSTPAGWFAIRIREHGTLNEVPERATTTNISGKLARINDVEMALTVEIGRTRMSIRDVLELEPGGVIELDRSAGAPADVLLNGRLIAYGEVVVIDQDYGVRITKILDVVERPN